MNKIVSRVLIVLAGFSLLSLFVWPLWRITLYAPQYPTGVDMHIYINKIGGSEPGTLQNINILNHYIGMKNIEPDSIPELKYFKYFVIGFVVLALLTALADKKFLYLTWFVLFSIALGLALYDFYLWEYDYGHTLDPNAPMKFDEVSFQPPLIGKKNLLNFVAISWPHIGGYFVVGALGMSALAAFLKFRRV